jgi:hypothetical protein
MSDRLQVVPGDIILLFILERCVTAPSGGDQREVRVMRAIEQVPHVSWSPRTTLQLRCDVPVSHRLIAQVSRRR